MIHQGKMPFAFSRPDFWLKLCFFRAYVRPAIHTGSIAVLARARIIARRVTKLRAICEWWHAQLCCWPASVFVRSSNNCFPNPHFMNEWAPNVRLWVTNERVFLFKIRLLGSSRHERRHPKKHRNRDIWQKIHYCLENVFTICRIVVSSPWLLMFCPVFLFNLGLLLLQIRNSHFLFLFPPLFRFLIISLDPFPLIWSRHLRWPQYSKLAVSLRHLYTLKRDLDSESFLC